MKTVLIAHGEPQPDLFYYCEVLLALMFVADSGADLPASYMSIWMLPDSRLSVQVHVTYASYRRLPWDMHLLGWCWKMGYLGGFE